MLELGEVRRKLHSSNDRPQYGFCEACQMNTPELGSRSLKRQVEQLLRASDFAQRLTVWDQFTARKVVSPLFGFLCSADETLKMRAVTALGRVVARLANEDLESARVVMRRLIWNLNDESGGIGWGAPEAMGEIMACHEKLANEYAHILLSFIRADGNFLEHPVLQRGVLWGLARLARERPRVLPQAEPWVAPFLDCSDPPARQLAAQIMGLLQNHGSKPQVPQQNPKESS